jgi:hypothetical protein
MPEEQLRGRFALLSHCQRLIRLLRRIREVEEILFHLDWRVLCMLQKNRSWTLRIFAERDFPREVFRR